MSFSGGCLCGEIRYEIERSHLSAIHCYCDMCRKAHGTAFSTHLFMHRDRLRLTQGADKLVVYESSAGAFRKFCPSCGSHIVVHGQTRDESVAVPAGTLDGTPDVTITGHMYTDELVPWHSIEDDLPQHATWPPGVTPSNP